MSDYFTPEDYDCVVRKDQDVWIVEYPDVPGVCASGANKVEALAAAEAILSLWLDNARDLGMTVPVPGEARSASGEFKLRLPRTLHGRLAGLAEECQISLNELTSRFLTNAVARTFSDDPYAPVAGLLLCNQLGGVRRAASGSLKEFSGVWVQRVSRVLHLHLQRLSEAEGTSLNALAIHLLSFELGTFRALQARIALPVPRQSAA